VQDIIAILLSASTCNMSTSSLRAVSRGRKSTLSAPPPHIAHAGMRIRQMILSAVRVWLVRAGHHCRSVERIHVRYVYLVAESGLSRLQMHPLTTSSPNHVCRHANPLNESFGSTRLVIVVQDTIAILLSVSMCDMCTSSLRAVSRGCKFTLSPPPPQIAHAGMRIRQMMFPAKCVRLAQCRTSLPFW